MRLIPRAAALARQARLRAERVFAQQTLRACEQLREPHGLHTVRRGHAPPRRYHRHPAGPQNPPPAHQDRRSSPWPCPRFRQLNILPGFHPCETCVRGVSGLLLSQPTTPFDTPSPRRRCASFSRLSSSSEIFPARIRANSRLSPSRTGESVSWSESCSYNSFFVYGQGILSISPSNVWKASNMELEASEELIYADPKWNMIVSETNCPGTVPPSGAMQRHDPLSELPASTSRTLAARSFAENGFWMKFIPCSSTPWWAMTLPV